MLRSGRISQIWIAARHPIVSVRVRVRHLPLLPPGAVLPGAKSQEPAREEPGGSLHRAAVRLCLPRGIAVPGDGHQWLPGAGHRYVCRIHRSVPLDERRGLRRVHLTQVGLGPSLPLTQTHVFKWVEQRAGISIYVNTLFWDKMAHIVRSRNSFTIVIILIGEDRVNWSVWLSGRPHLRGNWQKEDEITQVSSHLSLLELTCEHI